MSVMLAPIYRLSNTPGALDSGCHGVDDELHAFSRRHSDLEQAPRLVGADQHDEIVEIEDSDWVAVGVEHVIVIDPVVAGACQDHGIHAVNLP
jgi:hypothetical protein